MSFNPREIPNNLRMQPLIDQGLAEAKALLAAKSEDTLSAVELVNLALTYMEIGNWISVEKYASLALTAEAINDTPSNENKATALYALATRKRELNFCEEALIEFAQAQQFAESDWLKSNILRNIGLVYLKQQRFQDAHQCFQDAYGFVSRSSDITLGGSLPALANYSALALSRAALASGESPVPSLVLFDSASKEFDAIFTWKKIMDEVARRRSHDYISHCVHRGMILCEFSEKHPSEDHSANLLVAEKTLIEALNSRKENKADGQRLGDVCVWLGRVYERLHKIQSAKLSYDEALLQYRTVFTSEDAQQISDVKKRLANLPVTAVSIFNPQWLIQLYQNHAFQHWLTQLILWTVAIAALLVVTAFMVKATMLPLAVANVVTGLSKFAANAIFGTALAVGLATSAVLIHSRFFAPSPPASNNSGGSNTNTSEYGNKIK
jgi:tetratricopeptide (TPR) repeat protein